VGVVIDPSFDCQIMIEQIKKQDLQIKTILITHAHFDHMAGVNSLLESLPVKPSVALHPADLDLWRDRGEAFQCGFQMDALPDPDHFLKDGEVISFGDSEVVVHHTPGHSPGHVIFSIPAANTILTGDVLFANGIGRTDLTGGDYDQLIDSIRRKIMICPDDTRLLPGHGLETTVGFERLHNPFLQ
jgi:glyoxylase-like metal-dependent hydrolase (beta-lactamase superfamily II)